MKNIRTDLPKNQVDGPEHDSCAIYMSARKQGQSTFGTLKRSLSALMQMGHRTGFVNGEGDGAGIQTDIPRRLWGKKLTQAGMPSHLAGQPGFWVGHIFIPCDLDVEQLVDEITSRFNQAGLNILLLQPGRVRREMLGQNASLCPPEFWQAAGLSSLPDLDRILLDVQTRLENDYAIHFCSLSQYTVVYKLRGSVEALSRYYLDLQDHSYDTAIVITHARYSTNTVSTFERAQPFAVLGHNGEINTIARLRVEARQIGAVLPQDGSDSQDLDRTIHTLCANYGLSLVEAMEMAFPPVPYEIQRFPPDLGAVYQRLRQSFGPYAQGPAGIVARYGHCIVASVDALGLRPLWFIETEKEYIFCSERGAVPLENMVCDPRPLAPGEKIAIQMRRGEQPEIWYHPQIRQHIMVQMFQREAPQLASLYWRRLARNDMGELRLPWLNDPPHPRDAATVDEDGPPFQSYPHSLQTQVDLKARPVKLAWDNQASRGIDQALLSANGWTKDHLREVSELVSPDKNELIGSLGYDGPLAAMSMIRSNLADYYKESVAVVTNPAIDRDREVEVFSTSSLVGACPAIGEPHNPQDTLVVLELPVLLGGFPELCAPETAQKIAHEFGTMTIEDLVAVFDHPASLTLGVFPGETVQSASQRLADSAVQLAQNGIQCLLLDDWEAQEKGLDWLDPLLAVTAIDDALRNAPVGKNGNLRRRSALLIRSAAVRNLHDLALLIGFGADAVNPYAMFAVSLKAHERKVDEAQVEEILHRLVCNLKTGLEKITSTMGCHELRGYGHVCASIGLAPEVAEFLNSPNYFGSQAAGLTWEKLDEEAHRRGQELRGELDVSRLGHISRFNPHFWKAAAAYAQSQAGYSHLRETYRKLTSQSPVSLRHLMGIKFISDVLSPSDVNISIGDYSLPLVIDAMSFGSQGETSFRAYAHAAAELNMMCINGEGGELPEILGRYKKNRGQQIASGRFGVNVDFINSAAVLEIKIGQGAKPGEGGMLPGFKVTPKVAAARHTTPYVTLISPSNNHDLYSIEDLAQLIEELRMVNPHARISVKVPVVPGIGVIAVGIAKAGADIINISGYDGGTGAARKHSLQYVGLPTEIGIIQAHRALIEAGLRHKVELWANGGMKTGEDAVKMILLGANRVGFATLAMIAIGCTICRDCNLGTCHVGIATQINSIEEASQKGLKHFSPLEFDISVHRLVRTFKGIAEEMRALTAQLGTTDLQSLVGRADFLEQVQLTDRIDLSSLFEPAPVKPRPTREPGVGVLLIRPRNSLTTILTDLIINTVADNEREVTYQDTVSAIDRALGSRLAGELIRQKHLLEKIDRLHLRFGPSSLAGNGFAAWTMDKLDILIEGGAQDGAAKGAAGGRVAVMKGLNHDGLRIDGGVGKSFAYGAQGGTLIVQGNADSRACVRLSGARVVLGGEILAPLDDSAGVSGRVANIKGFACEYMTAGSVLIMGDPGPYAFSGMTGGVVYQQLVPEFGFDRPALQRRIASGANVRIQPVQPEDLADIQSLLEEYVEALEQTYQYDIADRIRTLRKEDQLMNRFVKIVPVI
jgi:glutamate synthase (NADPH/NADH) large chain